MHADAVCVGEAELVFDRILADLENGCLKGIYKSHVLCDMQTLRAPRLDLIKAQPLLQQDVYPDIARLSDRLYVLCRAPHVWDEVSL